MERLKTHGKLLAGALAAAALVGCEANGGFPGTGGGGNNGGGGDGPQIAGCEFPFGPSAHVLSGVTPDCSNCSVDNPENLIDSDATTFATVNVNSIGGGVAVIKAMFDDPDTPDPSGPKFSAGNVAGFVLEVPGPLSASVLPTFSIVTKLENIPQEEFPTNGVVGVNLLGVVGDRKSVV